MAIAIIDTSIFCNMLRVPGRCEAYQNIKQELQQKIEENTALLLPLATIFETGNHIAHIKSKDKEARREAAKRFVMAVEQALKGKAPYTPIRSDSLNDMPAWLASFPDSAMRGVSFGDTTIIDEFERQCKRHPSRRVYIWTRDQHLAGYDHAATS